MDLIGMRGDRVWERDKVDLIVDLIGEEGWEE